MEPKQVSIRELKSRLSHYLRQTKAGETLVITERGTPIGRIVPVDKPLAERLAGMTQTGLARWSGRPFAPRPSSTRANGPRTVADLLVEDRQ